MMATIRLARTGQAPLYHTVTLRRPLHDYDPTDDIEQFLSIGNCEEAQVTHETSNVLKGHIDVIVGFDANDDILRDRWDFTVMLERAS